MRLHAQSKIHVQSVCIVYIFRILLQGWVSKDSYAVVPQNVCVQRDRSMCAVHRAYAHRCVP